MSLLLTPPGDVGTNWDVGMDGWMNGGVGMIWDFETV